MPMSWPTTTWLLRSPFPTNWANVLATAVLNVPSAEIPKERNYLLNPAHPGFRRIRFSDPEPFYFDARLK